MDPIRKVTGPWAMTGIAVVLMVSLLMAECRQVQAPQNASQSPNTYQGNSARQPDADQGLVRHPSSIHYSKHARCRMKCRHIDESEVQEILERGTINMRKSQLSNTACRTRYAVEGKTHDGQQVRIIFAPCNTEETVVTVIDLGNEWQCECK